MPRRIKLILFFPVFVIIFMLGWALYVIGDKRLQRNDESSEKKRNGDQRAYFSNDSEIEMGLVEEVLEDHIVD